MDVDRAMPDSLGMECCESGRERAFLSVVDDDESVRESLRELLREFGFSVHVFPSGEAFLSSGDVDKTNCLILDIAMPGISGPDLHLDLKRRGFKIPVVFVTGQGDEALRIRVQKQGAAGFLLKPFTDAALLAAIETAMQVT